MQMIKGSLVYTQIEPQGKTTAIQTLVLASKATGLSELMKGSLVNIWGKEKPVPCTQRQQEQGQALKWVWFEFLPWHVLAEWLCTICWPLWVTFLLHETRSLVPTLKMLLEPYHDPSTQHGWHPEITSNRQMLSCPLLELYISELPQGRRDQRGPWKWLV